MQVKTVSFTQRLDCSHVLFRSLARSSSRTTSSKVVNPNYPRYPVVHYLQAPRSDHTIQDLQSIEWMPSELQDTWRIEESRLTDEVEVMSSRSRMLSVKI